MIEKIPVTTAKGNLRYKGVGLTRKEMALFEKINEIIDYLNRA